MIRLHVFNITADVVYTGIDFVSRKNDDDSSLHIRPIEIVKYPRSLEAMRNMYLYLHDAFTTENNHTGFAGDFLNYRMQLRIKVRRLSPGREVRECYDCTRRCLPGPQ